MAEIIDLTDTSRLCIEPDTDAENPREAWGTDLTGFVNLPNRGDSRRADVPAVHEPPAPIAEAHDRFDAASYVWVPSVGSYTNRPGWPRDRTEVTVRWARIFHDLTIEYDSEHGGYWFVDPEQLVENFWDAALGGQWMYANDVLTKSEVEAKIIQAEQESYRQWADGEVYGVILERLAQWERVDGVPASRTTWEEEASVWGCYLDDDYTPQVVAREHFTLTDEEEAALS